jgi:hypothetical protein
MVSDSSPSTSASSSGDENEPPPLVLNLEPVAHQIITLCAYEWDHRNVTVRFQKLTKGRYHEIFVAQCFEDLTSRTFQEGITLEKGESSAKDEISADSNPLWECIVRFSRQPEPPAKLLSELDTITLIRRNYSTVPVPQIYGINFGNDIRYQVGAQYMIMEKLPGRHLCRIWDKLDLEDKLKATEQIASVLATLSRISKNVIGSLPYDPDLDSSLTTATARAYFPPFG